MNPRIRSTKSYETLGTTYRYIKKMIHQRKSPRTSYIERSGRENFEWNTFEFPAWIDEVPEGSGSSEAWGIKETRKLDKILGPILRSLRGVLKEQEVAVVKRNRVWGSHRGPLYRETVRVGWSRTGPDHPNWPERFERLGRKIQGRAGSSELAQKVRVGWSGIGPDHPGFPRKFCPKR